MAIYYWEDVQGYVPNENTVIYYPILEDLLDHSGKWVTTTNIWTPTLTELNWVSCCRLNWSSSLDTNATLTNINSTMSIWFYRESGWGALIWNQPCGIYNWVAFTISNSTTFIYYVYWWSSSNSRSVSATWTWLQNNRHNYLVSNRKVYIDWEYKTAISSSAVIWWTQVLNIWWHNPASSCSRAYSTWYAWEAFVELWEWSADKIAEYVNATKARYWITTSHASDAAVK